MNTSSANILSMESIGSIEQQIKNNMIEEIYNYDFKNVCTKEQVYLKREKSCNIFLRYNKSKYV